MAMGWMFVTNLGSEVGILVVVLLDDGVRDWDGSDGYDIRLLGRFGLCLPIDVQLPPNCLHLSLDGGVPFLHSMNFHRQQHFHLYCCHFCARKRKMCLIPPF